MHKRSPSLLCILLSVLVILSACSRFHNESFAFLGKEYSGQINRMLSEEDYSSRFAIMQEIIQQILANEGGDTLRSFIHQYTLVSKDDPFNSYYLYVVADYFTGREPSLSEYYFKLILDHYNDVVLNNTSTHYLSIEKLLSQIRDPSTRIVYYQRLISNFSDSIDMGLTWYRLAQEYRRNDEFENYYLALREFQNYPETIIQGQSNIHQQVAEEIDFHFNSRKDWTHPNLDTLVANIKFALRNKQVQTLERYRAKETFFAVSWLQESSVSNTRPQFDLSRFLINARQISYSEDFQILNDNEAYLKTTGWSFRIPSWYFYFRKVDYPADPEIHGNWEWAGIFFGDTL